MPPKAPLPCNRKGQFVAQAGQPPSSLATPPAPRPLSQNPPPSRATSPSHIESSSRATSPSVATLSSRVDHSPIGNRPSDFDYAPTFAAPGHSRSSSPTVPAPIPSRSPSPTTSDFPTSLESGQVYHNQNQAPASRLILPAVLPTLVPRPHPRQPHPYILTPPKHRPRTPPSPSIPNPLAHPMPQLSHNIPSSFIPLSANMSHPASLGPAAMPSARSTHAPHFAGSKEELLPDFLNEYEDLADSFGLTEEQKVETVLRYIPRTL